MRWIASVLLLAGATGCPNPGAAICDNGDICPATRVCIPNAGCRVESDGGGDDGPGGDGGGLCVPATAADHAECAVAEWSEMHPPITANWVALWVGPAAVFVVADTGEVIEWDGSAWRQLGDAVDVGTATGIYGEQAETLYVTRNDNTIVHSPDWQPEAIAQGTPGGYTAIAGNVDSLFAVGASNLTAKREGGTWTRTVASQLPAINFKSAAKSSAHTIAVGDHAGVYYDGSTRSGGIAGVQIMEPTLRAVAIGTNIYVAGDSVDSDGGVTILRFDTGSFTKEPMNTASVDTITGLWVRDDDGFAVGGSSILRHVSGTWTDESNVLNHAYHAVSGNSTDVFVVGLNTIVRKSR